MRKNFLKSNILLLSSIVVTALAISGALYFSDRPESTSTPNEITPKRQEYADNVREEEGKQIIRITAKGGFYPIHSFAKAGTSTILRVDTNGTFDCSSVLRIPKLNISKNLPMFGTTDIDIGVQKVGKFYGTCGMGMYPFDIEFK